VPQLEAVAGEIGAAGGLADVLPWDLAGPDPAGLVTACLQRHGRVDVLVHAAGNQVRKPLFDYTAGDFDALVAVHLRAAFLLAQAAGRGMAARGGGAIVFVGSLTSERLGLPGTAGYAAAKSGLLGLMRTFAVALAPYGVRVKGVPERYVVAIGVQSHMGLDVPVADRTQGSMALLDGLIEAPGSHLHSFRRLWEDRSRPEPRTSAPRYVIPELIW